MNSTHRSPHVRRVRHFLGGAALLLSTGACKTASDSAATEVAAAPGFGSEDALILGRDESEALYLKMLAVETESGIAVAAETLHSVSGLIECRATSGAAASASPARCELRVRFAAPSVTAGATLSSTQPTTPPLSMRIASFASTLRADLDVTKIPLILADATCDYLGTKSPPFTVESVTCRITHPRLPTEAIFDGRIAEELAELTRSSTAFGTDVVIVTGALQCRLMDGSDRPACMVRPGVGSTLSGIVKPVSPPHSSIAARALFEAAGDRAQIGAGASPQITAREAAGMLSCTVDSRAVPNGGERRSFCRVAL